MERILKVIEKAQITSVTRGELSEMKAAQNTIIEIDHGLRELRRMILKPVNETTGETEEVQVFDREVLRQLHPVKPAVHVTGHSTKKDFGWGQRTYKTVRTLVHDKHIKTPYRYKTDLIKSIGVQVGKSVKICEAVAPVKLTKAPIEYTIPNKCTEILKGINYARNVYLPKKAKLGIKLVKEAVGYLKYQAECLKLKIEADKAYEEERQACFKQIQDEEEKMFHAEKEILKGLNTENQKIKFAELTETGEIDEDFCTKIRATASKERKELFRQIQEAERAEDKIFAKLAELNKAAITQLKAVRQPTLRLQHTLNDYMGMEA
jgi:hypothetical protein